MIELRALGSLQLRDSADGHEILSVLARAKPSSLLVYLALSPPNVSHSRDKLFELLWPDSSTEKARNSVNQALHVLRSGLGPEVIGTTERGELFLEPDAVWCDVAAFDEALASGHEREALELYGGHLWDGSDVSDCPAFEQWLDRERQRLRLQAVGAAVTLAQELERDGSFVDAAEWLRRARDWAPYDEAVVWPFLKLLHGLGEGDAAVREYDAYEERLADEGLTPSTEMAELIEKIRPSAAGREPAVLPMPQREDAALASVTTHPRASWRARGRAAAAIVVLGATLAIGATVMRNGRGDPPALDPTRVLVDIFENETGDPSLDPLGRMATDRVTAGLTYSTFVDVVSLGSRLLSLEPVVPDSDAMERSGRLQALARANGTGTVVWGSYYLQGDSLHFLAHVTDAATGEELTTIEPVSGPRDAPLAAVERLRDQVMTTLATLTDPQLAKWMRYASQPPTFEAYEEFVEGIELLTNMRPKEAIPHFLRAEALDSDFTMASLWAVFAYGNSGQRAQSDSVLQAVSERRGQLAPLDRLLLDYQLAWYGRDYHGALEAMRRFLEIAPGSEFLWKAAQAALLIGRPGEAIEFLTQADPESGWLRGWVPYWTVLTDAYHEVGDYELEHETLKRWRQLHPERTPPRQRVALRTLAALGRIEELEAYVLEQIQLKNLTATWFSELRVHGYPAAASDLAERALEWFESGPSNRELGSRQSYVYGSLLSRAGRWDEAKALFEDMLSVPGDFHAVAARQLAYVLASQGHRDQAFRALSQTPWANSPVIRAGVEAHLGEREGAMELLRESGLDPYMLGLHGIAMQYEFSSLLDYPPFREFARPAG